MPEMATDAGIDAIPEMSQNSENATSATDGIPEEMLSPREKRARMISHIQELLAEGPGPEKIAEEVAVAIKGNVNNVLPKMGLPPKSDLKVPELQFGSTESLRENGPVNILMVDNEPFTIVDLIVPLSVVSEGHLDVLIQKGETALEVAEAIARMEQQPDIIVMDYDLSGIMGDEVIAELRRLGVKSHIVGRSGNEAAILAFLKYNVPIAFCKPRDCSIDEEMAVLAESYEHRGDEFLDPGIAAGLVLDDEAGNGERAAQ